MEKNEAWIPFVRRNIRLGDMDVLAFVAKDAANDAEISTSCICVSLLQLRRSMQARDDRAEYPKDSLRWLVENLMLHTGYINGRTSALLYKNSITRSMLTRSMTLRRLFDMAVACRTNMGSVLADAGYTDTSLEHMYERHMLYVDGQAPVIREPAVIPSSAEHFFDAGQGKIDATTGLQTVHVDEPDGSVVFHTSTKLVLETKYDDALLRALLSGYKDSEGYSVTVKGGCIRLENSAWTHISRTNPVGSDDIDKDVAELEEVARLAGVKESIERLGISQADMQRLKDVF